MTVVEPVRRVRPERVHVVPGSRVVRWITSTDHKRMDSRPSIGSRIALGSSREVVGYDVTYQYQGRTATVRMDHKPADRLPVIDGAVVTATAAAPNG